GSVERIIHLRGRWGARRGWGRSVTRQILALARQSLPWEAVPPPTQSEAYELQPVELPGRNHSADEPPHPPRLPPASRARSKPRLPDCRPSGWRPPLALPAVARDRQPHACGAEGQCQMSAVWL